MLFNLIWSREVIVNHMAKESRINVHALKNATTTVTVSILHTAELVNKSPSRTCKQDSYWNDLTALIYSLDNGLHQIHKTFTCFWAFGANGNLIIPTLDVQRASCFFFFIYILVKDIPCIPQKYLQSIIQSNSTHISIILLALSAA